MIVRLILFYRIRQGIYDSIAIRLLALLIHLNKTNLSDNLLSAAQLLTISSNKSYAKCGNFTTMLMKKCEEIEMQFLTASETLILIYFSAAPTATTVTIGD